MAAPVTMNFPGLVMRRGVIVGMCVNERSTQGRGLDGQRKRDGNDLPHARSLFVTFHHRVKQTRHAGA